MKCPSCWCKHIFVTNTWTRAFTYRGILYQVIKRRRKCRHCGKVFTTLEKLEEGQIPPEDESKEEE